MTIPLFAADQELQTSDDYYTPAWVFETLDVEFDLDVAAPPGGVPWIPAKRFYTKADDGLSQPWEGKVWMNPPFSGIMPWVHRFIEHGCGVALLPMSKSLWFNQMWEWADACVALPPSLKFDKGAVFQGTLLWACGDECVEAIGRIGYVR